MSQTSDVDVCTGEKSNHSRRFFQSSYESLDQHDKHLEEDVQGYVDVIFQNHRVAEQRFEVSPKIISRKLNVTMVSIGVERIVFP